MFALTRCGVPVQRASALEGRDLDWLAAHPGKASNLCNLLRIGGRVDAEAILAALQEAALRHDALRTRFMRAPDGGWQREVLDDIPAASAFFEHLPPADDEREIVEALRLGCDARFEPEAWPLWRVSVAHAPRATFIALRLAHVISDVSANRILIRTLSDCLAGSAARPPDFTLADYVAAQVEWLASADCEGKLALFADMYGRHAEALRAGDPSHGRAAPAAHLPAVHCEMLSADTTRLATRRAREAGVTLVVFFKGIAGMMLSCASGRTQHFSSVIFAGRHLRGSESILGHLGSHVPLFHDLETPATIGAYLLGLSRQWLLNTWHFGAVPMGMLEEAIGSSDSSFRRHGFFNRATLNFLPLPLPELAPTFADLPLAMIPEQRAMYLTTHDAQIVFRLVDDCVQVTLKCPAHAPERLLVLRQALHRCVEAAIDTPLLAPGELLRETRHLRAER